MDAAAQMFFTLSLGFGALISFASYMPLKNNCVRDAYTVVIINCGTSLIAGIVVFSILGHREKVTGNAADKVCPFLLFLPPVVYRMQSLGFSGHFGARLLDLNFYSAL